MNYARILGNGLTAFFTVLAAANWAGSNEALTIALGTALIQAGLAAALEIKRGGEAPKGKPAPLFASAITLF